MGFVKACVGVLISTSLLCIALGPEVVKGLGKWQVALIAVSLLIAQLSAERE